MASTIGLWALALLVASVSSQTCNKNGFYCVADNVYQSCLDGSTTVNSQAQVCPQGTRCTNDCNEPCLPSQMTPCITCNDRGFYCPNENSFQLCLGGSNATETEVYRCGKGVVCSNYCSTQCTLKACSNPICKESAGQKAHPNNNKSFFLCSLTTDEIYIATEYTCPGTSIFEEGKGCVKDPNVKPPTFVCKGKGKYPDPDSNAGYFLCVSTSTGYQATYYSCPPGAIFNSLTLECTFKVMSRTSASLTVLATFQCLESGRVLDPESCSHYYWCSPEDYEAYHFPCPDGARFNPNTKQCTQIDDFECPQ